MKTALLAAAAFGLVSFPAAYSAIVGVTFTGVTTPDFAFPSGLLGEFPAGTKWSLRVEWDDSAAPTFSSATQAGYALTKMTFTLQGKSGAWTTSSVSANRSFSLSKNGGGHEIQFTSGWGPADHTNQTLPGGAQPYSINLTLGDPTGTALPVLTPAPKGIDPAAWSPDATKTYLKFYLNNLASQYLLGTVDLVADEPDIAIAASGKNLVDARSTLAFGSAKPGKSASKTLTIRNTGSAPLTNLSLRVSGAARKDFKLGKIGKTTLAPGAKTTAKLTFKPKKKGNRKALLKVLSNDPDENPFDIGLNGKGK